MKIQHASAVRTARLLGLALTPLMLAVVHPEAHAMSSATNPSLQSDTANFDTPTDVVNAFHAALKRGDATAALNLMAEDVVIFESGGVERNRAEYEPTISSPTRPSVPQQQERPSAKRSLPTETSHLL